MRAPSFLSTRAIPNVTRPCSFFRARHFIRDFAKPRTHARQEPRWRSRRLMSFAFAGGGSLVAALSILSLGYGRDLSPLPDHLSLPPRPPLPKSDSRDPSIPRFRLSEIRTHDAKSGNPWVTDRK